MSTNKTKEILSLLNKVNKNTSFNYEVTLESFREINRIWSYHQNKQKNNYFFSGAKFFTFGIGSYCSYRFFDERLNSIQTFIWLVNNRLEKITQKDVDDILIENGVKIKNLL